jgi:hypothetical protein
MDRNEEHDESYYATSCRACIICKCGVRVWYGCGKEQTTRPIYCRKCTKRELEKLKRNTQFEIEGTMISDKTDEQIIMFYLRRAIPSDSNRKESVN